MSVDIITTSAYPEMHEHCRWWVSRQTCGARHVAHECDRPGSGGDRRRALADLLEGSDADYFMIGDDDDYVHPGYVERVLAEMGPSGIHGYVPQRAYSLRDRRWGDMGVRKRSLMTFVVFRGDHKGGVLRALLDGSEFPSVRAPLMTSDLMVMRGLMRDGHRAITPRKNLGGSRYFPNEDRDFSWLRRWVDSEACDRYIRMADERGWL